MPETFGARLRQQRERQQVTLASIADQTKIAISLLEGLERDDVSHWPSGIFRRSFIRAYAGRVGLDADAVVKEFLELYPDPIEVVPVPPLTGRDGASDPAGQRPPTRLHSVISSAIEALGRLHRPSVEVAPAAPLPAAPGAAPAPAAVEWQPDLSAAARLCTEMSQVVAVDDVEPLLGRAAGILEAGGLILWVWNPRLSALTPTLAHGYPDDMMAQMPAVKRDADNALAASFRAARMRVVPGTDAANGALVVPLMTPEGCGGVLTLELSHSHEQMESVRAIATIFAAQLTTFIAQAPLADAVNA
jgi:transcriptional regulator with XRE-family HTH domain